MFKKILYLLLISFIVIQFFQINKTPNNALSGDIKTKYSVSESLDKTLKVACNDCHSNETKYPWYASIQPIGWWLQAHMNEGKKHLNFSNFTERRIAYQNHKFEEIIEMVEKKEMPIPSYTWLGLHPEAKLTDPQRQEIIDWAKSNMSLLSSTYPPDSLVLKRN
ncbi:MAG: heme-binding domain-containing protein [Saprospiraceae bacterium]